MSRGGFDLGYGDLPAGADGSSRGGRISIREGLTPAHEFSVLVHEFAHELLHQVDDRPESKTVRETEAVAFVVCQAIGLESGTAASDYLQLYGRNSEMLATSLDRVQRISAQIIAAATLSDAPTHES